MTEHDASAPLTEDDVAAIEIRLAQRWQSGRIISETDVKQMQADDRRLVADWRRQRAENEALRSARDSGGGAVMDLVDAFTYPAGDVNHTEIIDGKVVHIAEPGEMPDMEPPKVVLRGEVQSDVPRTADDVVRDGWKAILRAQVERVDAGIMGAPAFRVGQRVRQKAEHGGGPVMFVRGLFTIGGVLSLSASTDPSPYGTAAGMSGPVDMFEAVD